MPIIIEEAPGYLQVFSDSSVKRFAPVIATTSPENSSVDIRFKSKDVTIDASKPITARIFLPADHHVPLPLLVYFHGGGFCIGSTTWLGYHHFLGDLSVAASCIILSIDYRLAPEHRLPAAYDDCYASLQWLTGNNNNELWLKTNADMSRVFLSGDSAGGNIVHNVAMRAMGEKVSGVEIKGLLPIHPYFGSEERTEKEMGREGAEEVASNDMFWRLSIPEGSNRDYFGCNFNKGGLMAVEWEEFPAVEVYVAGLDFLKERGLMYAEFLERKGVKEVRVVEAEDEAHVFHVFDPKGNATRLLQTRISDFIRAHGI